VLLTAATVLVVVPYLAGVLVPYYVNGLHHLPLAELAGGAHDPKDLWPQGTLGGLVQAGGYLSLALTPLGLVLVGGGSGVLAVRHLLPPVRALRSRVATVCLVAIAVACAAGIAWMAGETGTALTAWRMD
jgi:hypothetical protein